MFEYKEEYGYFTNACLNVTDSCNLACTYCFVEQQPHFMTLDTAKKCVDFLANNIKLSKHHKGNLTFFGGEPTLMWDEIIVPLTLYVKENYDILIDLGITTNGTLLNQERINFLSKYHITPLLSCDGAKQAQNLNRPCRNGQDSFELVSKNIPLLLEKFPNTTLRSTISKESIDQTFHTYLFAVNNGFKTHFTTPNMRVNWSREEIDKLTTQIELIYGHIFSQFILGKMPIKCNFIIDTLNMIRKNHVIKDPDISRSIFRCGLGTISASFGYDGNIYGCQEQVSYSDGYFHIGDIENGIDKEKHFALLSDYAQKCIHTCQTPELCKTCEIANFCHSFGCPSVNHDINNNLFISPNIECEWKKILYNNTIKMIHLLEKNKLF